MAKVFSFSKLAAITCGTLLLSSAAQASLVGDEITLSVVVPYEFTSSGTTTETAVVGGGVEATILLDQGLGNSNATWDVDVAASSFTITMVTGGLNSGPVLTLSDLDWVPDPGIITGVTLTAVNGTNLTAASILGVGADFVTVDLGEGNGGEFGWTATYTLETQHVPVPAAVWLFGSGLLGLIGIARRKAA